MGIMQSMAAAGPPRTSLPTTATATATNAGATAIASVELTNLAVFQRILTPGGTFSFGNWVGNTAWVGLYECRWTTTSGSLTSGTTGTWQSLSTTRTWTKSSTGVDATVIGTLEIRPVNATYVMSTCTVTLNALGGP